MRSFFDLQKSSWLLCIPSTKIEGLQYSGRASPRVLGCALKRRPNDTLGSTDLNLCDSTTLRWRIGDVSSVICHYVVMSFRPFTSTCPRWTMMNHDEPWWTMMNHAAWLKIGLADPSNRQRAWISSSCALRILAADRGLLGAEATAICMR